MNMIKVLWRRFQKGFGTCAMLLVEGSSETGLFDIYLTTFLESAISEMQKLWGHHFFSKCLKFNIDFKNAVKISEKVFCFSDNLIWFGTVKLSLLRTGYFSLIANVLTSSTNVWHLIERLFPTQFPWQWSMNMIKVLWCRFQKCLATFTMLLVERSSQTGLLRHLYDYVFAVRNFGNRKCLRDIFFFKIFEI